MGIFQILTGCTLLFGFLTVGNFVSNSNILIYSTISIVYFIIPLMYIYTVRLSETKTERDYEHFIVPVLVLIYCIVKASHGRVVNDLKSLPLDSFVILQAGIFINSGYFIAMNRLIRSYQKGILDNYSAIEHIRLKWLIIDLRIGIIASSLFIITNLIDYFLIVEPLLWLSMLEIISLILFLLFLVSVAYFSFTQAELQPNTQTAKELAYEKQRLSENVEQIYVNQLLKYMEMEKPYLEPELSLGKLAEEVNIPQAHLTMILNIHLKQNFYVFVNTYRIKAACEMLRETADKKNILTIAMDSGFNSKTTFNTFFRKTMGMTPSEYKKRG